MSLEKRFWNKVNIGSSDECWEWIASKVPKGYGHMKISSNQKPGIAHRIAYDLTFGKIPQGFCVLHHCDNPSCCNPKHLFLGTYADNNFDRDKKGHTAWGEKNGIAKLSVEKVRKIRILYSMGSFSYNDLALKFNVGKTTIQNVINRESWSRVE